MTKHAPPIRVFGLGRSEIWIGQTTIPTSADVLFGLTLALAVAHPGSLPQAELLDLLWPGVANDRRRHSLRQLIYRLRRLGVQLRSSALSLGIASPEVTLDIRETQSTDWPLTASPADIESALRVLPGYRPTFSEPFRDWLDALRDQVTLNARDGCLQQIRLARGRGAWHHLNVWSAHCLRVDPLNEEATLARAESMAMRGSKAEAQGVLGRYLEELGDHASTLGLPARVLRNRISDIDDIGVADTSHAPEGRETEFSILVYAARSARAGSGNIVFVHGAGGTGKSILLNHFSSFSVTLGFSALRAALGRTASQPPFALLGVLLRTALEMPGALACYPNDLRLLRKLAHESESDALDRGPVDPRQLAHALRSLFLELANEKPLLVVVDNYSHADRESLAAMELILPELSRARILFVLSSRSRPVDCLRSIASDSREIHLGDYSREATRQLAHAMGAPGLDPESADLLDRLYARTGGHPQFVRELLAESVDAARAGVTLPGLEASIWARVGDLSSAALAVLSTLSLLSPGTHTRRTLECATTGEDDVASSLAELFEAGLLPLHGEPDVRPYEVVAEVVASRMSSSVASSIHLRVGAYFERLAESSGAAEPAWEGARHLSLARERERAANLLRATARAQLMLGKASAAAELFKGAADCATTRTTQVRYGFEELGVRRQCGDWKRAETLCREIGATSHRRLFSPDELAEVYLTSLEAELHLGDHPHETARRASAVMTDHHFPAHSRERAASLTAILASNLSNPRLLLDAKQSVPELSRSKEGLSFEARLVHIIFEHDLGSLDKARELTEGLVGRARANGSAEEIVRALLAASMPTRSLGLTDATTELLEEAYRESEVNQLWALAARCADTLSGVHFDAGRLADSDHWQRVADSNCTSLASMWTSRTVIHQRLRVLTHTKPLSSINEPFLLRHREIVISDQLRMRRNHDLATLLMLAARRGDRQASTLLLDQLIRANDSLRGQRRLDYILAAIAVGMRLVASNEYNLARAERLCAELRTSSFPPLWYLDAALSHSMHGLFPSD